MLTCKEKRKDELMQVEHSFLLILQTCSCNRKRKKMYLALLIYRYLEVISYLNSSQIFCITKEGTKGHTPKVGDPLPCRTTNFEFEKLHLQPKFLILPLNN